MTTTEKTRVPWAGVVVLAAGLAIMAALSWQAAGRLPDPVTLVGAGRGGADQHASKALVLGGFPLSAVAIGLVLLITPKLWRDDRTHRKARDLGLGILTPVLVSGHLLLLRAADGQIASALGYLAAAVALVVVVIGNVWPKQVLRLPAVLRGPGVEAALEAQRRRLRPTGIAMMLLGLVAIAAAWPAPMVSMAVSMAAVLVMAAVPIVTVWWSVTNVNRRRPSGGR